MPSAIGKKTWRKAGHADDRTRPLSDRGREQAWALAGLLATFAPARVISSATRRCVDTVASLRRAGRRPG